MSTCEFNNVMPLRNSRYISSLIIKPGKIFFTMYTNPLSLIIIIFCMFLSIGLMFKRKRNNKKTSPHFIPHLYRGQGNFTSYFTGILTPPSNMLSRTRRVIHHFFSSPSVLGAVHCAQCSTYSYG